MSSKGNRAALLSSIGLKNKYIKCLVVDNENKRIEGIVNITEDEQYFKFRTGTYTVDLKNSYILTGNIRMLIYKLDDSISKEMFNDTGGVVPSEIMRLYVEKAQLFNLLNKDNSGEIVKYIIIGVLVLGGLYMFGGV
ncbi:MAG: hypothetical protein HF967_07570 [Methanosarcinales archaeon]|nr:hypothetical protein [Methanosarcinales archaeon]